MALLNIIAHRLDRQDPHQPANLGLREQCWEHNGRIEECFRELKHTMIKRLGKEYGRFVNDSENPLSAWLAEYMSDKLSFESFSRNAMAQLKQGFDQSEEPLDGFLFFAHETQEGQHYLHIFVVSHNTGLFIDGELEISESFYLDTTGLTLAAKLNIDDWQSDDQHRVANALTLLRWRGQKDLSDIFSGFVGFGEKIDVSGETEAFLDIVSDYTKELPEDLAQQTKKQVVNYCLEQDKIGKPVVMEELSSELKDNPPKRAKRIEEEGENEPEGDAHLQIDLPEFAQYVEEKKPEVRKELIPDTSQLRQFVRLSGRTQQMSMSFASSCLGDSIVYDPTDDSLTIKDIPPKLKARLAKLLQEEGDS